MYLLLEFHKFINESYDDRSLSEDYIYDKLCENHQKLLEAADLDANKRRFYMLLVENPIGRLIQQDDVERFEWYTNRIVLRFLNSLDDDIELHNKEFQHVISVSIPANLGQINNDILSHYIFDLIGKGFNFDMAFLKRVCGDAHATLTL